MAGGECSDDRRPDESEQEEALEPVLKKQNVERKVVVAAATAVSFNGNATEALRVKKLAPEAVLPTRGSDHAAGYDLSRSVLSELRRALVISLLCAIRRRFLFQPIVPLSRLERALQFLISNAGSRMLSGPLAVKAESRVVNKIMSEVVVLPAAALVLSFP